MLAEDDQALAAFDKALSFPRIESDVLIVICQYRAGIYVRQKNYEAAVSTFTTTLELGPPRVAHLYKGRGAAHFYLKHYEQALADITKAVELLDLSALNRIPLADVASCPDEKFRTGMRALPDKAIESLKSKLDAPDPARAHSILSLLLYRSSDLELSNYEQAVAHAKKAVELRPDEFAYHNNLAWVLATCPVLKLRDPGQAVAHAKKAVELETGSPTYWNTLGVAQYRNGDWKSAIEALMESVQLSKGGSSFDFFFLAMANWQLNEKEKARAWYEQAVAWMDKNEPQDEELKRFRAEATALLGLAKAAQTQKKKP